MKIYQKYNGGNILYNVDNLLTLLNDIAPFDTAEDFDNVGLLVGSKNTNINSITVCLDCTLANIDDAIKNKSNIIISHHPIIFGGINNVVSDNLNGKVIEKLIKNDINLIAMHTNLDKAPNGIADSLAQSINLNKTVTSISDYSRLINLDYAVSVIDLVNIIDVALNTKTRVYGNKLANVKSLVCFPGAGGNTAYEAITVGANAILTGEIKHHQIVEACSSGVVVLDVGHFSSEFIGMKNLANILNNKLKNIPVYISKATPIE